MTQVDCLGSLKISTVPPGAAVFVDGQSAGHAPVTLDSLVCGAHTVHVLPPIEAGWGGQAKDTTVSTMRGVYRLTVRLPGTLHLSSVPSGASVFTDQTPVGYTPLFLSRDASHSYRIRMEASNRHPHRFVWLPKAGALTRYEITLLEANPPKESRNGAKIGPLEVGLVGMGMAVASVISSREADRAYDRYGRTANPEKIEELYERAVRFDHWSSAFWIGFQLSIVGALALWIGGQ